MTLPIHTIGHSNHSLERFLGLLNQHAIGAVADLTSHPYSKWAAQFRKGLLARDLGKAGNEQLLELAGARRTAMMCAEEDPTRCHRSHLIAPALMQRGVAERFAMIASCHVARLHEE